MDRTRRTLLATLGTGATVGLAGCTDVLGGGGGGDGGGNTYLQPAEWEVDPSALPFPTHGDRLPAATLPAPLRDAESLTLPDDFTGRDTLVTFVYTHCMTMCPRLTAILEGVQDHVIDEGFPDEVAFVETTFDPSRDDAERLRQWAEDHHVAMDAGNWYFLRPETTARAKDVVQDTYGVSFTKTTPQDMDAYMFAHTGLVLLANRDGYVERAYKLQSGGEPQVRWQDVRDDLTTLREREA
jgi:protein SCO1/2